MKDILLNSDKDLKILNGDFEIGFADEQIIGLVVESNKGEFKESPSSGVGIADYLNAIDGSPQQSSLNREINLQMRLNNITGYSHKDVEIKLNAE